MHSLCNAAIRAATYPIRRFGSIEARLGMTGLALALVLVINQQVLAHEF